ncbi:MAG: hypothetical protein GAK31_00502 [Stenotrophomonas maltophilia]|uniref:Uncharacterized protein n=1 Tax=Stenotrophomonas maltophilia TaxID=40324 RepID=A0A7V8FJL0_STEMA|nr:MAG: hypothetical protein GAK31_00502 [Stenotrophomonas maltophilia]
MADGDGRWILSIATIDRVQVRAWACDWNYRVHSFAGRVWAGRTVAWRARANENAAPAGGVFEQHG